MATKIRLQRGGRKGNPIYRIVVADARAPRDGKFIEKLGSFNPNVASNQVQLNFDSAVKWYMSGAIPTETAKKILSTEGVLLKKHLLVGVKKGAITEEVADQKFQAWLDEKGKENSSLEAAKAKEAEDKAKADAAERAKIREDLEANAKAVEAAKIAEVEAAEAAAKAEAAAEEAPEAEATPEAETPAEEAPEAKAE